jgi:hypothetical protein
MERNKEPAVYRHPTMQIRCAEEAMLEQCIAYMSYGVKRGPFWKDVPEDYKHYPSPHQRSITRMIARRLIWC